MKGGLVERMIAGGYIKADEPGNPLVVALRMLSIPVVLFCIRLKIHPNIVTSISLALGCLGSLFYVIDEKLAYITAWTASIVLDYTDGTVARKSGKESHFGYLFDMLGDRVKLITLVIAFSMGEGSSLAITFAAVVISVVVLTEVVSHLFVRHFPTEPRIAISVWQAPYRMFLEFNMHSFLIYGLGILPAGKVGLLATAWLSLILLLNLKLECRARMYRYGEFSVQINKRLLNKLISRLSKSDKP